MMRITEDTPPDMLTGAMDLTVHLPTHNKPVKMSVERSTPMMDVLVLITTRYNLQVSRYQIEAISLDYSDKVLPYRPNTPLGALDTQHIRVIPKLKWAPPPRPVNKGLAPQPFENTFRLKVHLPKNQLYVTRVSRYIYLEDIMTKVCDDKNLDPRKYEFRHPGNPDQILDAKLTLNDYQITEIYLMVRGTVTGFSTNDIMAIQREEERKQLHTKAGGGVFNMIFKKGRNSFEYGSAISENQSASQSDDSRSVTPPAIQPSFISLNTSPKTPKDQPKPPQRKRKPAPKPPTTLDRVVDTPTTIRPSSSTEAIVDSVSDLPANTITNICHSRTSSDSSGYHEASILSDNLINNSSLPRVHQRPKTVIGVHEVELGKANVRLIHGDHSKSTGNLMALASKSKSTTSLITTGRKKKIAPLPPAQLTQPSDRQTTQQQELTKSLTINDSTTNPLTTTEASVDTTLVENVPPVPELGSSLDMKNHQHSSTRELEPSQSLEPPSAQPPKVRPRLRAPVPNPRTHLHRRRLSTTSSTTIHSNNDSMDRSSVVSTFWDEANSASISLSNDGGDVDSLNNETVDIKVVNGADEEEDCNSECFTKDGSLIETVNIKVVNAADEEEDCNSKCYTKDGDKSAEDALIEEAFNPILALWEATNTSVIEEPKAKAQDNYLQAIESINIDLFTRKDKKLNNFDYLRGLATDSSDRGGSTIKPGNLGDEPPKYIKKSEQSEVPNSIGRSTKFDTLSRRRGFQIGSSLNSAETTSVSSLSVTNDIASSLADSVSLHSSNSHHTLPETSELEEEDDDLKDVNVSLFSVDEMNSKKRKLSKKGSRHEFYGIHDSIVGSQSVSSMDGIPGFKGVRKWKNLNSLDGISLMSSMTNGTGDWDIDDVTNSESPEAMLRINKSSITTDESNADSYLDTANQNQVSSTENHNGLNDANSTSEIPKQDTEPVLEWKYELPLPPTAFRDHSQDNLDNMTQYDTTTLVSERFRGDSVVSNPELFEKLNKLKETQSTLSDTATTVSTEDDNKSIYNKLSLELLQKRKSLVYNREIATTLKSPETLPVRDAFKFTDELKDAVMQTSLKSKMVTSSLQHTSGLPNFKISTYDEPKSKINIYEDDTISSNQTAMINNDISYKTHSLMRNQHNGTTATNSFKPVGRSGSFSINTWSAVNPLKRSTSNAALLHPSNEEEGNTSKVKSITDMSACNAGGLQSLGVMKQIRNTLQSPVVDSKPTEVLEIRRNSLQKSNDHQTQDVDSSNITAITKETKPSKCWSPPAITLGTWDDRPKSEIFVRADSNYKFKSMNTLSVKNSYKSDGLVVISNSNGYTQSTLFENTPFISRKNPHHITNGGDNNVSIKINGSEPISSSRETGNVTIRIGSTSSVNNKNNIEPLLVGTSKNVQSQITYRKPFGNINSVRPHSIAIETNYDVSRRPVVTSATLKKSVTHINNSNHYSVSVNKPERPSSVYLMNNNNRNYSVDYNANRKSWNTLRNGSTEPHLSNKSTTDSNNSTYNTNVNVPFSQMRLKRTVSSKILTQPTANGTEMGFGRVLDTVPDNVNNTLDRRQQNGTSFCPPPPPPPLLQPPIIQKPSRQRTTSVDDPRTALLSAIQNFGGKKGLRTIRT